MTRRARGAAPRPRANRRRPRRWVGRAAVRAVAEGLGSTRRAAFFVAIALGCFTVAVGLRYSIDHPYFSVARVDVVGTKRLAPDQVRGWLGTVVGRSMWRVSPRRLEADLCARPEVADAEVQRLFPRRLIVRVREREPRAVVRVGGRRPFLVDAEGVVLGPAGADGEDLPIVTVERVGAMGAKAPARSGGRAAASAGGGVRPWQVATAVAVASLLEREAGPLSISELSLRRGDRGGLDLVGFSDRARLRLRLGWGRWTEKARALGRVLAYEARRRAGGLAALRGELDLRRPEAVVGRWAAREGAA